jgi:predicted NBD/HSP70 family sugar kinase
MYLHPSELRVANTRRLFRLLLSRGGGSRAELARVSGLSAVTAGKVVDELIGMGLAEERADTRVEGVAKPAMGRPPRTVSLRRSAAVPVVELGVRESAIAMLSLAEDGPVRRRAFRTPPSASKFCSIARGLLPEFAGAAGGAISGPLVVSVPGVLDGAADRVLFSPNLRWSEDAGFLPRLANLWRRPLCAVQEIQALALGHRATPDAPDSFVLVDFGDGVGGAVVSGGELLHGPAPLCGELGHTGVYRNRRRCGCGSVGCLETLVSRRGLLRSLRDAAGPERATWQHLQDRVARKGVERWLAPSIDAAAGIIAGAINILGIQDVVLTGDLPALHPDVPARLQSRIEAHALIGRFGKLRCHAAPRRRDRGLILAAAERVLLPASASEAIA